MNSWVRSTHSGQEGSIALTPHSVLTSSSFAPLVSSLTPRLPQMNLNLNLMILAQVVVLSEQRAD